MEGRSSQVMKEAWLAAVAWPFRAAETGLGRPMAGRLSGVPAVRPRRGSAPRLAGPRQHGPWRRPVNPAQPLPCRPQSQMSPGVKSHVSAFPGKKSVFLVGGAALASDHMTPSVLGRGISIFRVASVTRITNILSLVFYCSLKRVNGVTLI